MTGRPDPGGPSWFKKPGAVLATKEWIKTWIYRILIAILVLEIYQLVNKYFLGHRTWIEK